MDFLLESNTSINILIQKNDGCQVSLIIPKTLDKLNLRYAPLRRNDDVGVVQNADVDLPFNHHQNEHAHDERRHGAFFEVTVATSGFISI